ncbi:Poly (ADP-ribose) glycohydrolase [Gossypium arboreum]|uniref:Poly (ADP-ribose) glycohydrolase n=1 Tax=Gossypium arboreum TaxID=29729 RepID=A0A0B0NH91_GOSAR|nr:Poly (ADP-ribose) glycohydrolase [Gossypium arboreum]
MIIPCHLFDIIVGLPVEPLGILKDTRNSHTHGRIPMPYPRYDPTWDHISMPMPCPRHSLTWDRKSMPMPCPRHGLT